MQELMSTLKKENTATRYRYPFFIDRHEAAGRLMHESRIEHEPEDPDIETHGNGE